MIDKIILFLRQYFIWWGYQPQDERETSIYLGAYRRAFLTFIYCVIVFVVISSIDPNYYFSLVEIIGELFYPLLISLVALLALFIGGTTFIKQNVNFTQPDRNARFINYLILIGVLISTVVITIKYSGLSI